MGEGDLPHTHSLCLKIIPHATWNMSLIFMTAEMVRTKNPCVDEPRGLLVSCPVGTRPTLHCLPLMEAFEISPKCSPSFQFSFPNLFLAFECRDLSEMQIKLCPCSFEPCHSSPVQNSQACVYIDCHYSTSFYILLHSSTSFCQLSLNMQSPKGINWH